MSIRTASRLPSTLTRSLQAEYIFCPVWSRDLVHDHPLFNRR